MKRKIDFMLFFNYFGENVDVNLNNFDRTIIELILKEPTLTSEKISIKIEKTKRTSERYLKALQDIGYLKRDESDKSGIGK